MKITTANIYQCDHCGKRQFRLCDMSRHEKWCKKNPNNQHTCYQYCKHLIKEEEEYQGSDYVGKRTIFKCAVTEQKMYSYIAEKKKLPIVKEDGNIRMPLECDKYESQNEYYFADTSSDEVNQNSNVMDYMRDWDF
jgi:hypothetical protein